MSTSAKTPERFSETDIEVFLSAAALGTAYRSTKLYESGWILTERSEQDVDDGYHDCECGNVHTLEWTQLYLLITKAKTFVVSTYDLGGSDGEDFGKDLNAALDYYNEQLEKLQDSDWALADYKWSPYLNLENPPDLPKQFRKTKKIGPVTALDVERAFSRLNPDRI